MLNLLKCPPYPLIRLSLVSPPLEPQPLDMPRLDGEHRGPLVNIAAWFLLVTMILFVASKVVTKWRMVRRLQNDDYLFVTAMVSTTVSNSDGQNSLEQSS